MKMPQLLRYKCHTCKKLVIDLKEHVAEHYAKGETVVITFYRG